MDWIEILPCCVALQSFMHNTDPCPARRAVNSCGENFIDRWVRALESVEASDSLSAFFVRLVSTSERHDLADAKQWPDM